MTDAQILEMDKVLEMLAEQAQSEAARARCRALEPLRNDRLLENALRETSDAAALIEGLGQPPLALMEELAARLTTAKQGGLLSPEELLGVATFAATVRRMKEYLKKGEGFRLELSLTGRALTELGAVQAEIEGAIRGDGVADSASNRLRDVRRRMESAKGSVKQKLASLLRAHPKWFSDNYVAERNGRWVLPVRAQFRSQVSGTVVDRSQTGGTVFIEPSAVRAAQDELNALAIEEENEVRRILYALTCAVADAAESIEGDMALMERLDFAFAKGKLSLRMGARAVPVTRERRICIRQGVHPLIGRDSAVPLDFELGGDTRGVAVTGPNTGGKTVALKTVGLLTLMAQSGLHVPVGEGSRLCMCDQVLTDIGDGQSIAENLSTFSAHMVRTLDILKRASRESLVLLDELGSGTDPAEGMGIAVAVLEALANRGCLFVVTTHYPEVKAFAENAPCMVNARMQFDRRSLRPLYRMEIGRAGESCALHIARRLGFSDAFIDRAARAAYEGALGLEDGDTQRRTEPGARLETYRAPKQAPERSRIFERGDCARLFPERQLVIVVQPADEMGDVLVQLRGGEKRRVKYKRLQRVVPAAELYPPDYDFSILFDTVANRKARHGMDRGQTGRVAVIREGNDSN
ncbi:MAG: DNA mismatch repair protein MutS [Clostridia bacterium]|nr:DNA mismatch repair protein MutS [Clostridia bacterium]